MPGDVPTTDESFARLHRAGWSIGDAAFAGPAGTVWLVTGTNGENLIRAEGPTRAAAWWAAFEQVVAGGTIGHRPVAKAMGG
jgi:hypothetical protein